MFILAPSAWADERGRWALNQISYFSNVTDAEMLSEYSAIIGAAVGGSAAIIRSYITLNRQFRYQEYQKRLERLEKAHIALSQIEREGSLIQSTASMRNENATKYDSEWLSNKERVDELRAIIDLYMPHLSNVASDLYEELTKFWYEHSIALSNKEDSIQPSQHFYNQVVPISNNIQRLCKSIKLELTHSRQIMGAKN